jgi:signal peptidase I
MNSPRNEANKFAAPPLTKPGMDESRWEKIAQNLKTVGGAVLLALLIRTCLFEAFEIEGPSMEPTLLNGDRVVVAKFLYGLFLPFREQADLNWGGPNLGDVVIIKSPADGVDIVKRVIGVAGDTIEMHDDLVYRNGKPLPREDKGRCQSGIGPANPRCHWYDSKVGDREFTTSSSRLSFDPPAVKVPPDHIYVLGDHRDSSNDSRNSALGVIPNTRVKGRALSIYWSSYYPREGEPRSYLTGGVPEEEGVRWSRMFHNVR